MISTKGRYGLRVMLDLARNAGDDYITLRQISERQGISKKYLEIIIKKLSDGHLVQSLPGKGGGYRLSRAPEDYTVGEILEWMEDTLAPVACLTAEASRCPRADTCITLPLWSEFNTLVHDFFYGKRLSDLL